MLRFVGLLGVEGLGSWGVWGFGFEDLRGLGFVVRQGPKRRVWASKGLGLLRGLDGLDHVRVSGSRDWGMPA